MKSLPAQSFFSIGLIALIVAILALFTIHAKAAPSTVQVETSATATTSVAYMTAGTASSTYQMDSNNVFSAGKPLTMQSVDSAYAYIQYAASSTSAILIVTPQWSNNGIDWYGFSAATNANPAANGISLLATSTLTYQYLPNSTATSSIVLQLPTVSTEHERVIYGTQGANGAVYSEYVLKFNAQSTP